MLKIREDIWNKIMEYDRQHETNFVPLISQKVNGSSKGAYHRGIVHGICLALTINGVINKEDALEILESLPKEN